MLIFSWKIFLGSMMLLDFSLLPTSTTINLYQLKSMVSKVCDEKFFGSETMVFLVDINETGSGSTHLLGA